MFRPMWRKYMPAGNRCDLCGGLAGSECDGVNEIGLQGQSVAAADQQRHGFPHRSRFQFQMELVCQLSLLQADPGRWRSGRYRRVFLRRQAGRAGVNSARPQQPWYIVTGLTTSITTNTTNDFHYSFLRNYWQWGTDNAPPQISGLGGAMEPFGETSSTMCWRPLT